VSARSPEALGGDLERFLVDERLEIVATLKRLLAAREPLSVHWDGNDSFALTALLAVNPDFEELVLDCLGDARANQRLLQSEELSIVATMDGVKIQFSAPRAETTVFEGRPALRVRLPNLMLRLQRREAYRVRAPLSCELALEVDGRLCVLELRVADLSLGGIALVTDRDYLNVMPGKLIDNCRVGLGGIGTLATRLEVRNVMESRGKSGARQLRLGCRFVNLPGTMETLVARYIANLERSRRALA
jgi:c-di-GMP-binding flagellar brake protein YcgR